MPSKILVLPDFVIDQIAAGEVLENPASAVKELVENSLDAGAKEIRIEIEGGGLQRILIEDDGSGMSCTDAMLCLKRHATSKIRSAEELEKLATMGFRGEALAALSSVSKLELKTSDGIESTRIVASGGEISKVEVCARNRGTSIEARGLFFNAPARLKFQKSSAAAAAAILKAVETLALSNPEVQFQLTSNGKLLFAAKAKEWKERVEEVRGPFAHVLAHSEGNISIRGVLGRPEESKVTRSGQTLFINRRPIVSPLVGKAVKEGFGTRMLESVFPVFVLFLEMPPDFVDVNVHPQKKEVRFREEGRIFAAVRKAVASLFEGEVPEVAPMPWDFTAAPQGFFPEPAPFAFAEEVSLPVKIRGRPLALLGNYLLVEEVYREGLKNRWLGQGGSSDFLAGARDIARGKDRSEDEKQDVNPTQHPTDFSVTSGMGWSLVDLKGAEARILFETMEMEKKPAMQPLIWPLEIDSKSPEETAELLKVVGIEARPLGKWSLAIDALPAGMKESLAVEFVRQYSSERKLAASVTKTCRLRNRKFSLEEASMIWESLQNCKDRIYDPLGRRIVTPVSEEDLAKRFE